MKKDLDLEVVLKSNTYYVDISFGKIKEMIKTIERFLGDEIGDEGPDVCKDELFNEVSKELREYVVTLLKKLSPIIVREK